MRAEAERTKYKALSTKHRAPAQVTNSPLWTYYRAVKLIEILKLAIAAIWAHKLRSALTLLGMIIGVTAFVWSFR